MKMSLVRRYAAFCALILFFSAPVFAFSAEKKSSLPSTAGILKNVDAGADIYEYVGDNLIARGHVVLKSGPNRITADRAVVNVHTNDIEASGNVTLMRFATEERLVDSEEYNDLLNDFSKKIEKIGVEEIPGGATRIRVKITSTNSYIKADRIVGNLKSGLFRFQDFALKANAVFAAASYAERLPSGKINLENGRFTTCDYIMDDHDHYAFTVSKASLTPRNYDSGIQNYNPSHNKHTITAYNALLRLWDIPVLWLPAIYKPQDSDTFGIDLQMGRSADWGVWVRMNKGFTVMDDPYINLNGILDVYSDRGVGWGGRANIVTGNSRTEFFGYSIHDDKPYNNWDYDTSDTSQWYKNNSRLKIPSDRYDIKLTNLTHITPRLDFRGQFELLSDYNFLNDFFPDRYKNENIQPPTYAALEYQFDRATAAILTTVRVNEFYTTLQRLPEFHLDFQRQELFKGLYYQSESSAAYLDMRWRKYDKSSKYGDIENYQSGRFDTTQFLYYPINLDFLNIVPRAGIRATAYTAKSKNDMSDQALSTMFYADSVDAGLLGATPFRNFQVSNQADFRFMGEVGVEANTKIYRTWNDVRSYMLGLDGMRHVLVPYINYTYIPEPTMDPENILYFDENDRLKEQHFIRFGMINRIQTREGNYGTERIREWFSIENYWDFHMKQTQGFNNVGDLGTRIKFTPFDGLTLTSELLIDAGGNNDHDSEAIRASGREAGRVGLNKLKYINKWNTTLKYQVSKDWSFRLSYIYSDQYTQRSVYSMGSMIDSLNSTATSLTANYPRAQWCTAAMTFPTYIDPKLKGSLFCNYDVDAALMQKIGVSLMRNFHCVNVGIEVGQECNRDSDQDKAYSYYIGGVLQLSTMPSAKLSMKTGLQ